VRIALLTETFLPKVDGIVNTLCHLLEYLAARGHQSLLIAPAGGPANFAATPVVGRPGLRFPLYRELTLVPPPNVDQALGHFQPDLVHVLNPVSLGLSGLAWARLRGVPVVASYHTDLPGFAERWGLAWAVPLLWTFLRGVHGFADLNLCPSRHTQRELQRQGFRRVRVWGRGVDTELFSPAHRNPTWRRRLGAGAATGQLLLYVGRLSPEKRVDWLRPVLDQNPGARLAIVGDGPARPALEALFAGTPTVFTGYLRGAELAAAYAAADVFAFPAANETLGNVVLEAMASGLPVVTANSGGQLDHVQHNRHGCLFEADDPQDLSIQVSRLLRFPELARAYGQAGRQHALAHTWGETFDGLLEQYRAVVRRRARVTRAARLAPRVF